MKKLLAMVLALVMTLSLAVVGSNAAFKDADKVNETYAEAVDVLAGMKVFQGYTDGSFQPKGAITRAEVAAIVYRLYTGDVADKQASLYATYNKFSDMDGAKWAAGYIGYCANAGLVKGYDAKTFGPADKVTGYQALAMILRAVGYDKNGEFTGADWQLHVAQYAQQLGVLKNVKNEDLNAPASRELVAELLFRTAAEVPMVTYTPALGYTNLTAIVNGTKNDTLGKKNFGLAYTESTSDEFGRPYYVWFDSRDTKTGAYVSGTSTLYATVKASPVATYTTAVTECDVAHDYGFAKTKTFDVYTNGVYAKDGDTLNAINTVDKIGAQGRLTEVYKDRIVYIDTLLAEVTKVANATFDAANHLKTPATITLKVYDGLTKGISTNTAVYTPVTETNGSTNYEYAVGDMILVYAVQTAASKVDTTAAKQYVELNGKADSVVGAQSTIWANNAKHVVGTTTYDDNNRFILDEAGTEVTNHTWYFDSYGNLIGASNIVSTNYAVLKSLRWIVGAPGHAEATLIDMTGAESTVTVKALDGDDGKTFAAWENKTYTPAYALYKNGIDEVKFVGTTAYVSDEGSNNSIFNGYALYRVDTNLDSTVSLEGYGIVNYVAGATFAANGSAILYSGSVVKYVSDNTQYLVRTLDAATNTFKYEAISGTKAMVSYTSADLFYVDNNNDGVADYVYIKGGQKTNATDALVYVTTGAYTNGLTDGTGISTIVANVNGVDNQTLTAKAAKTSEIAKLANGLNKVFKVTYDADGYVDNAELVQAADVNLTSNTGYSVRYMGNSVSMNGATMIGNISVRVDGATVLGRVTGDYSALTDTVLSQNGIWVVYKATPYNTAAYVYVGEKLDSTAAAAAAALQGKTIADISLTDATQDTLNTAVTAAIKAKLAEEGVNTAGLTFTFQIAPTVPANNTKGTLVWSQVGITDAYGTTVAAGGINGKVDNLYSETSLKAAVNTAIASCNSVGTNTTYEHLKVAMKAAVEGIANVSNFVVTSAAPSHYAAGDVISVTYSLTYNGQSYTGATTVTLAA